MTCDHKFIDSKCCLKCGWAPDERNAMPKAMTDELSDCEKAWRKLYSNAQAILVRDENRGYTELRYSADDLHDAYGAGWEARGARGSK